MSRSLWPGRDLSGAELQRSFLIRAHIRLSVSTRRTTPGDLGFPVLNLLFGRMAMFICYDTWAP